MAKKQAAKSKAKKAITLDMNIVNMDAFISMLLALQESGATEIDEAIAWAQEQKGEEADFEEEDEDEDDEDDEEDDSEDDDEDDEDDEDDSDDDDDDEDEDDDE